MGISPVIAVPKMLDAVALKKEDVDIYEVCTFEMNVPHFSDGHLHRSTKLLHLNSRTASTNWAFLSRRLTQSEIQRSLTKGR